MLYANSKDADQLARMHSSIRTFVIRMTLSVVISETPRLLVISVAEQTEYVPMTWLNLRLNGSIVTHLLLLR